MTFDRAADRFKAYHLRSIHATSEERAAINQELKEVYASLAEEEKQDFNTQLQTFLVREMARLKTDYEAMQGNAPEAQ
ncbi:MAG: hypothetical protein LH606_11025 [Cytophagaceae bacterium]|nr:hypothetical protein [Cytophagaceae bacterium]